MQRPRLPAVLVSAALFAALAACGGPINGSIYAGDVTPTTPGVTCQKTRGSAQIKDGALAFTPNEGTWTLIGLARPGGKADAERIATGANRQPYETRFEGTWTAETVQGTYTTPRCAFTVNLTRR